VQEFGRLLLSLGLLIAFVGILLLVAGRLPGLGQLPGDFYYESDNLRFYFPLVTCLVLSVLFSSVLYFLRFFI